MTVPTDRIPPHSLEKLCTKCGVTKPWSEFYPVGRGPSPERPRPSCKVCCLTSVRTPDRYQKMKAHRTANRDRMNAYARKYNRTHRKELAARRKLGRAVRSGQLTPLPCEVCGKADTEGHHTDYDRPLDVRWLCIKHHKAEHRKHG